ncbi:MAG: hypothetical protein M9916_04765 [Crocinitomicaceae bacterium]|nr:hypothetical protein [Crocinitomicaceae bacterium]
MLNLTEIASLIEKPELCSAVHTNDLEKLCITYPYSQIFPLLYLKSLAQSSDIRLDAELQKYAYRISDRTVLYNLLHEKSNVLPVELVEPQTVLQVDEQPVELPKTSIEIVETEVQTQSLEPVVESLEEPAISEITLEEVVEEKEIYTEDTEEVLPSLPNELLQTLSGGIGYSLEAEEAKITQIEQEQLEAAKKEQEKQRLIEVLTVKKVVVEEETERSFTSWLKQNDAYVDLEEEKPNVDELLGSIHQNEVLVDTEKEKLFASRTEKNEMYNPIKKAKQSLDESQLPVSETLARIFAAQGNFPKAIQIYQQLMLIIPEKKIFFATRIEELNKKLNT